MSVESPSRRTRKQVASPPETDALVEKVDAALMVVTHFFSGRTVGEYMSRVGLSDVQRSLFRALRVVRDSPAPVSIRDVQHALGLSHPASSRLIDRCVIEGFVNRTESAVDRRHTILTLTPSGRQAAKEVEGARQEVMAAVVARWSIEDLTSLAIYLERLGFELRKVREDPPWSGSASG